MPPFIGMPGPRSVERVVQCRMLPGLTTPYRETITLVDLFSGQNILQASDDDTDQVDTQTSALVGWPASMVWGG